jgi:serine protease Do
MNTWKNLTAMAIAVSVLGTSAIAQGKEKSKDKPDKTQEIIIRQKGDKVEKTTIIVDGDKVTINGKPVDEYKSDDLTIIRRDGSAIAAMPRLRALQAPYGSARSFGSADVWEGKGNKAMLGVVTEKVDDGVKITNITKESGADKAGLKEGDVITKVGDKKIETSADLVSAVGAFKPKDKVDITYKRNGKESKTSATLGENQSRTWSFNSNDNDFNFDQNGVFTPGAGGGFTFTRKPKIGMQVEDVEEGSGVAVKDVDDDSPASKAGMKEGDVITQMNGKNIAGVDEVREEIKDLKEGSSVKVTFKRGTKTETTEIKIPKKLKTANL